MNSVPEQLITDNTVSDSPGKHSEEFPGESPVNRYMQKSHDESSNIKETTQMFSPLPFLQMEMKMQDIFHDPSLYMSQEQTTTRDIFLQQPINMEDGMTDMNAFNTKDVNHMKDMDLVNQLSDHIPNVFATDSDENHETPTASLECDSEAILLDPSVRSDASSTEDLFQDAKSLKPADEILQKSQMKIQLAGPREFLFFNPASVTCGIVTCGGVCPGLNNVIRGLVNILTYRYGVKRVLGFKYGFFGLVPGQQEPVHLTPDLVKDIHQFGGTMLGTSRGPQRADVMVQTLIDRQVNILYCIGGDGTQKGAHAIALEIERRQLQISVIGIGKTIDNDLLYVDRSFGFETAVQLSQTALLAAHEEARSAHNGIGIVKLMGRESGAIALNASLANGDVNVVLVPEVKFKMDDLTKYLAERLKTKNHCLIVCAEGAGLDFLPDTGRKDASGNRILTDIGDFLKTEISKGLKKEGIDHSIKYIDPSYTIRGGITNSSDSILCTLYAQMAAHAGLAGKTDVMIGLLHGSFVHLPLSKVVEGRKNVDIRGIHWQGFLDATGSPFAH